MKLFLVFCVREKTRVKTGMDNNSEQIDKSDRRESVARKKDDKRKNLIRTDTNDNNETKQRS